MAYTLVKRVSGKQTTHLTDLTCFSHTAGLVSVQSPSYSKCYAVPRYAVPLVHCGSRKCHIVPRWTLVGWAAGFAPTQPQMGEGSAS